MIRGHKKMNEGLISTPNDKGISINVYYNLLKVYNKQEEYKDLVLSKQDLWTLSGLGGKYNSEKLKKLIANLTKSETFELKNNVTISGSMFITEETKDGKLNIEVPNTFRKYLFYKKDIDLMTKAKNKDKLTIKELDYWDRELSTKKSELILLNQAHILNIRGKYPKRLYTLLKQWDYTGLLEMKWDKFKEIMEIPSTYQAGNIDQKILNPSKKELLEKAKIKITEIKKIKEGRSISKIKIFFEAPKEEKIVKDKKKPSKKPDKISDIREPKKYQEEDIKKAMKRCAEVEGINENFLLEMRKRSENIFMNTIEKYIK